MSNQIYDELISVADEHTSDVLELCGAVWDLILSKPETEQKSCFEVFLKEIDLLELDIEDINKFFFALQKENLSQGNMQADQLGQRILANLIKKNVTEEEFYADLWNRLMDDVLSGGRESQVMLLTRFWMDQRIPYYQLPEGCTMGNDEYRAAMDKIEPQVKKATFIIHAGLSQKTQKASLLMDVAEEIEDRDARAVFWAVMLDREAIRQSRGRPKTPETPETKEADGA